MTAPRRQGPRPLGLHLAASMTALLTSQAGLTLSRSGSLRWRGELRRRLDDLLPSLDAAPPEQLAIAIDREMRRRIDQLLSGIEGYRRHEARRALEPPAALWSEGASRLLDFGGSGPVVLFVPSLINRAYILDLAPGNSLMRWLAANGIRPLLLDWGAPGDLERGFTLADIVAGRLERMLERAAAAAGGPVPLVGYCMGGTLCVAAAQRRPDLVAALGLLATPWDFHAAGTGPAAQMAAMLPFFEPALASLGELPVDAIQALFALLDPLLALRKFTRFAEFDPDGPQALAFVALEDWLNDGVALPAAIARECLGGWYGRNDTARHGWQVLGRPVVPAEIARPTLVMVPSQDRIVPPESARALALEISGARLLPVPLGHIGMVVSRGAEQRVWQPLRDWLLKPD
jgi:polyhydroxyalkanoate synthase